jgi:hypothetical protein
MARVHIDSFAGRATELKPKDRTVLKLLQALAADPRISTFERGNYWLENLIRDAKQQGLIVSDPEEPYPWCKFDLTDAGRAMLATQPEKT